MTEMLFALAFGMELSKIRLDVQESADTYYAQIAGTEESGQSSADSVQTVNITYDVSANGTVQGDIEEFRSLVGSVLNDDRGWKRAGVTFTEVESNGEMHLMLTEPDVLESLDGCSGELSCRYGSMVMVNDDRWLYGSDSYNELGVSLNNYRIMVINHEVGHYLGHYHIEACETSTGLAPIMLQQSTGLRGCSPNSWPLPNELWHRF